jgi:hypothetical protein
VLIWIVVAAIGLRAVALRHSLPLSTDVWRYLWDGRVANAGTNPYRYPPNAPELRSLRDRNWKPINFRDVPTIYPPAAQLLFAGVTRVDDRDPLLLRSVFAVFDLGTVILLIPLLRRTGRPPEHVIWYAWCPLPIVESAVGGHIDAVGLFWLVAAFLLAARGKARPGPGSAIAFAAAAMSKGLAFLATPFFVRRGGGRFAAWCCAACVALLLPFLGAGWHLFGGLKAYLSAWKANASVFLLADWMLARVTPTHFLIVRYSSLAAVLVAVALLAWRQRPGAEGLLAASFAALGAQLLLGAPTLPWYVVWVVPALCWWRLPALVVFTLTVAVQYYGLWIYPDAPHLLLWLGYAPVYALLIGQGVRCRRRGHR